VQQPIRNIEKFIRSFAFLPIRHTHLSEKEIGVKSRECRAQGNRLFGEERYMDAVRKYSEPIQLWRADADKCLTNRSLCLLCAGQPRLALADALMAVRMRPDLAKRFYRVACAQAALKNFGPALNAFSHAMRLVPDDALAKQGCERAHAAFLQCCDMVGYHLHLLPDGERRPPLALCGHSATEVPCLDGAVVIGGANAIDGRQRRALAARAEPTASL
jgi:tetratricopeptide (TPR) repeat protein